MKVMLFGATGMVGQGALRECLLDPDVERVLTVVRRGTGHAHRKVEELVHGNFFDFSSVEARFSGYDACLFCLGISSAGMTEEAYRRVTFDITLAAARSVIRRNANLTFILCQAPHRPASAAARCGRG